MYPDEVRECAFEPDGVEIRCIECGKPTGETGTCEDVGFCARCRQADPASTGSSEKGRRGMSERQHCNQPMRYDAIADGDAFDGQQLVGTWYCGQCCTMQPVYKPVVRRFRISAHDSGYYCVSIPWYDGGEVVDAADYDTTRQLLTQLTEALEDMLQYPYDQLVTGRACAALTAARNAQATGGSATKDEGSNER